ncbi:hypothetical protein K2173_007197 [Erythroxylum novogranatense]|uniref:Uncharacterized protein n=1 Tax=Erythroxylum novogranatense TaxID=1862640 RepID=A0AAV8T084_9ROSI|nr:hypothetical protein K2173_007197 [Erythroxylum novogranatense]
MMKLSRFLKSSNLLGKPSVGDALGLHVFSSQAGISTARSDFTVKDRIFAPYTVFKGKAALSVNPCLPTFTKSTSGGFKVDRRGSVMFTFWPAVGERKYDYEKRQLFAMSTTEVGSLISLGPKDSTEFFHDPAMLSSNAGQVRKSLSIKPYTEGNGYFISLNVVNNILKTNDKFLVPVTTGEFAVLRTACSFALPHIMGWDRLTNQHHEGTVKGPSKIDPRMPDLEWDK